MKTKKHSRFQEQVNTNGNITKQALYFFLIHYKLEKGRLFFERLYQILFTQ